MTSEEWIANIPSEQDRKYAREAVNAALESERKGEVVLWTGEMGSIGLYVPPIPGVEGAHGQVIFRPTKAKEAGL